MPSVLDLDHPEVQKQLGMADVLIFQRNVIVPQVWRAMDYWRAIGRAVLVDLDDHYPSLPPSNPAFQYWIRNTPDMKPHPVEALEEGLKHADGLTSPSEVILEDWAHIVPGYHVPNYTNRKWYAALTQKPVGFSDYLFGYAGDTALRMREREGSAGQVMLGWGGSVSHVDSWLYSGIIPALDRLFEKWPGLRLKFCGHEGRLDTFFSRWGDKVVRQTGVQPQDWPRVVSSFDIGLAPLDMRPLNPPWREGAPVASYDERRSWLKAVEYLCAGVTWVASRSRTYEKLARHGTCVENTPEAWFAALDHKIEYLAAEKILAWEKRNWAMKRLTFEANVRSYIQTLEHVLNQKGARRGDALPDVWYVMSQPEAQAQAGVTA